MRKIFQPAHEWGITMNQVVPLLPSIIRLKKVITSELRLNLIFWSRYSAVQHLPVGFPSSHSSPHSLCFSETNMINMHYLLESRFVFLKVLHVQMGVYPRVTGWYDSNEGRVCSAGTGVRLCDLITLHANSDRGRPRRQSEYRRQGGGGRERERGGREGREMCRKWIEWERERDEEKEGVMTELQALCLYMYLQAN